MQNALSKDSLGEHLGLAWSESLFQERRGSRGDFLEGKGQDLKQGRGFGGSGARGSRRVYEADALESINISCGPVAEFPHSIKCTS